MPPVRVRPVAGRASISASKPLTLHRIGIKQQVGVGPAADRRKLQVLGLEEIAGEVEAQPAVEQRRLDARLIGHGVFAVGRGHVAVEQDAALDRRGAIALGDAGIDVDVLTDLLERAHVPGQNAVLDLGGRLGNRPAADEARAEVENAVRDQGLLVVVPACAGLQRQPAFELVIDRSEDAERLGILPLVDDRARARRRRAREIERLDVEILVEVEQAGLVSEAGLVVRRDADFLGELVEARDVVLALRLERNDARAECRRRRRCRRGFSARRASSWSPSRA